MQSMDAIWSLLNGLTEKMIWQFCHFLAFLKIEEKSIS